MCSLSPKTTINFHHVCVCLSCGDVIQKFLSWQLRHTTLNEFAYNADESQHEQAHTLSLIVAMISILLICIRHLALLCIYVLWLTFKCTIFENFLNKKTYKPSATYLVAHRVWPFNVLIHECRFNYVVVAFKHKHAARFHIIFTSLKIIFNLYTISVWYLYFLNSIFIQKSCGPHSFICILVFVECRWSWCEKTVWTFDETFQRDCHFTKLIESIVNIWTVNTYSNRIRQTKNE